jgi:hypothetical protein
MVRNHEPWDLAEPEVNDLGQPATQSIAKELDCIYGPPHWPHGISDDEEEFDKLQAQIEIDHEHEHQDISHSDLSIIDRMADSGTDRLCLTQEFEGLIAVSQEHQQPQDTLQSQPRREQQYRSDAFLVENHCCQQPSYAMKSSSTLQPSRQPISPANPLLSSGTTDVMSGEQILGMTTQWNKQKEAGNRNYISQMSSITQSFDQGSYGIKNGAINVSWGEQSTLIDLVNGTIRPDILSLRC